jgi:hypothetical protein
VPVVHGERRGIGGNEEWRREEWDIAVQLAGGIGLYRIFRDLRQDVWFVEGLYD